MEFPSHHPLPTTPMPLSDALKKVKGFLVETEPGDAAPVSATPFPAAPNEAPKPTKTLEQIAREQPGPSLEEIQVPAKPTQPVERPDGSVDYGAIYAMAGLPTAAFTAEQVLEILASLPAELPMEAKRATLKVTLNAMGATLGVTPETVVADASRKLTALGGFAQNFTKDATEYVQKAQEDIARMETEIARRRESIASAQARQAHMVEACNHEADRLDDVLEFFTLDAGSSRHAPGP